MEGRGNHFDPDILDRFVALDPDLYNSFFGDEYDRIGEEISAIVRRYFLRDAESS